MIKFKCNKLTGDNSLEGFQKQGITTHYRLLNKQDFLTALNAKLMEESLEVTQAANRAEVMAELGDVLNVIDALMNEYHISHQELLTAKREKNKERGGFQKGIFLESIEMPEKHPRVRHFRASPSKYPEIQ